ncbi:unnamed protein product [Musa acuminata subsp. burmannicoides]
MAAELQTLAAASVSRKRKPDHKTGKKPSKRVLQKASSMAAAKPRKPSRQMRKLFRKRAREYHSDEEEESDEEPSSEEEESDRDLDVVDDDGSGGDDEDDGEGAQHGITRFVEGCRAFRVAFMKIMKKHLPDDPLGPILSAHKKLVAEKLAEEVSEHKTTAEMKKEKQMEAEKGHVKPANFLDAREKLLVSVATKGVVKLFNAVSKAQSSQSGLNPSGSKNAKVLAKQRKQAFFSELQKPTTQFCDSKSMDKNNELGWAPLRNNYMLTSSKLKDWDKMPEAAAVVDHKQVSSESSSDEE